ncbi:HupE/UreJ family protein [Tropicibacter naphthalenivorans]|uniref:HupE / UreJ protein n=1 Tax=Tropicibacter naphthalenivorans TaxID=441103 RepID=A0A0P1G6S2_9RHOB|nr:HupE/UreJ family protein [Tropicibacter naphthalenivorans]CUH77406.1 hypothetical protein TRN7648_01461 [Tropicibacter naphthalenivorans]SMC58232.1 HupE / UreJ protein [Tropicibacter naphthalenivorans]
MIRIFFMAMAFWLQALTASAHEVQSAIADFVTQNGQLRMELRVGIEPLMAGVNLDGVMDTNETAASDDIDALRALEPAALQERLDARLPGILSKITVTANGTALPLSATDTTIPPVGNVALPRESQLFLTADLPDGAQTLEITWPAEYGSLILRQMGVEDGYTGYLAGESSGPIAIQGGDALNGWQTFAAYIPVGFEHILPMGLDHILFVLGLFFLSTHLRPLLWQISAFTLAHTVTLALGALGYVTIPGSIVEPIIAASIVYVAVENIVSDKLHRWRPLVIFVFGLLHGLGFASVLQEFGLPQDQFVAGLIGFNVGVEFGQLTVIAIAFLLVVMAQRVDKGIVDVRTGQVVYGVLALSFVALGWLLNGPAFTETMGAGAPVFLLPLAALSVLCLLAASNVDRLHAYRRFVATPASLAIAAVGAYWFVERVFL